jgi:hypothetical protein
VGVPVSSITATGSVSSLGRLVLFAITGSSLLGLSVYGYRTSAAAFWTCELTITCAHKVSPTVKNIPGSCTNRVPDIVFNLRICD